MRRFFLTFLLALPLATLLAGCCANDTCDCQDIRADALYLRFPITADTLAEPGSFLASEVDTLTLLRYHALGSSTPPDSVVVRRDSARTGQPIILGNTEPFASQGTRKIDAYYYVLALPRGSRRQRRPRRLFQINQIQLRGRYEGDGCCTCYQNTRKTAVVDGQQLDLTDTNGQPVYLDLRR